MLTVRLKSAYKLEISGEPIPNFAADEVLLKIEAVGICGSDLLRYRGVTYENEDSDQSIILGHEFSATVVDIGNKVKNVKIGDRVAVEAGQNCGGCEWCHKGQPNLCPNVRFCGTPPTDGALREYMAWPARLLFRLGKNLTFEDGVMAEVLGICLHSLDLAHVETAQTVAVLGAGPIGLGTIHLLRQTKGPALIIASDILPQRVNYAKTLGADAAFNAKTTDITEKVLELTNGRGVDVVFEAAGKAQTCRQTVHIAVPGGHVVLIGIPEDDITPFATAQARRKGLTFRFVRRSRMNYNRSLTLLEKGILDMRTFVTHHFPISKSQEAFELVNNYQDGVIKAVIHPSQK